LVERGFPDTVAGWMALPGVGAYTARAVMAFAHECDVGLVDTNSARVLARWHGRRLSVREAQEAADSCVPVGRGWAWNQAMLDLGALVCRSRPGCDGCPTAPWCGWKGQGPDPAIGTAGASGRQSRFEGSDRQARGRLLRAVGEGPLATAAAAGAMGCDRPRAGRLVALLVAEGLIRQTGDRLTLP
jgi:A/G-specific adenine glycosylase